MSCLRCIPGAIINGQKDEVLEETVCGIQYAEVSLNEKKTGKGTFLLDFSNNHSTFNESGEYETEFYVQGKRVTREA